MIFPRGPACPGPRTIELALVRGEEPVGDIDGDALFAFSASKPSDPSRGKVNVPHADGAMLAAVAFERRMVLQNQLGVIEHRPIRVDLPFIDGAEVMNRSSVFVFLDG